jgi:hypothetical protein
MARRPSNPLDLIPSPEAIRAKLIETRTLADRLQILLEVSERIHQPTDGTNADTRFNDRVEVPRV